MSSSAVCNNALFIGQLSYITSRADALLPNCIIFISLLDLCSFILYQPYQLNLVYYGYQKDNKKEVY